MIDNFVTQHIHERISLFFHLLSCRLIMIQIKKLIVHTENKILFQQELKHKDLTEQPELYLRLCQRSMVKIFHKTS